MNLDSAIQAVQTFNTFQVGNRTLRADFTNEFTTNDFGGGSQGGPGARGNQQGGIQGIGMGIGKRSTNNNNFNNNNSFNNNNNSFNNNNSYNNNNGNSNMRGGMGNNNFGNKINQQGPFGNPSMGGMQKGGPYNNNNNNNYGGGTGRQQGYNNNNQNTSLPDPTQLATPNEISQTLSQLPPPQLLDFLSSSGELLSQNPVQMMEVFRSNPVLTYAVLQALLLMGLVDSQVVAKVVNAAASGTPYNFLEDLPNLKQQQRLASEGVTDSSANVTRNSTSPEIPLPPPPMPPPSSDQQGLMPPSSQPQQQQKQPAQVDPSQAALISQVLKLSDEQISMLPPDQQAVILQLKASYQG